MSVGATVAAAATNGEEEAPRESRPKYKYDWYQTETEVRINVLIKKTKQENVEVNFQEHQVTIHIIVGEGDEFYLELPLAHRINPDKCAVKIYGTKVELRMKKTEGLHWDSLEKKSSEEEGPTLQKPKDVVVKKKEGDIEDVVHKYPSSSHYTRNWDKLVAEVKEEEKNEKPEGDAALNKLFQQIYEGGNDEVRKAMNKSFVESGGTVLSTNWGEIGAKKVERQTPQGMEWKQYDK